VRGYILGMNRKLFAQKSARALIHGVWAHDAKIMNFPK